MKKIKLEVNQVFWFQSFIKNVVQSKMCYGLGVLERSILKDLMLNPSLNKCSFKSNSFKLKEHEAIAFRRAIYEYFHAKEGVPIDYEFNNELRNWNNQIVIQL
ncbi:hypothetical protein AVL50_07285 [Flammeovirga sp. SJP92]|nr:hypothetical protein AVL50_07285 [Flammeovirga sp. SJP92]